MAMGVSEEKFWDSTPKSLEVYAKADLIRRKNEDEALYRNGLYTLNAVMVVVDRALSGRKARAKYLDEPLLETAQKQIDAKRAERGELSKIEEKDYVDKVFRQLEIIGHNFNMSHNK